MIRLLNLCVIAALVFAAAHVYKIKFESTRQAERVAKLRLEIRREHETIAALRNPDLNWLMAVTVGAALFAGLWHVFGEWLSNLLDPRWLGAASGAGGPA